MPDITDAIVAERDALPLRLAVMDDVPALQQLITYSVRSLQAADYSPAQLDGAIGSVFGVDRQLILDGTYFVVEDGARIVACGGWSRRQKRSGSDASDDQDNSPLIPGQDAARIRAFFVAPSHARRGIASRLLKGCEFAALQFGFTSMELDATLTGIGLYARHGFTRGEGRDLPLPNGEVLPIVAMHKSLVAGDDNRSNS